MMRTMSYCAAVLLTFAVFFQVRASLPDTSCVSMELPETGSIISTPLCTVGVKTCKQVSTVQFRAQYSMPDRAMDTVIIIGSVTSPPFKRVWKTESLPNVVYKGITVYAEALLKNGMRQTVSRQGIFMVTKPVFRPMAMIPFSKSNGSPLFSQSRTDKRLPATVHASACYSDDALRFSIRVLSPIVFNSLSHEMLSEMGIDLCLDPRLLRRPYPSDSTVVLTIPLDGVPFITMHKAVWNASGSFEISTNKAPASCIYDIRKEDTKGFAISLAVSKDLMSGSIPDSFGCNIIVKIPGDNNHIERLSWGNASGPGAYSPLLWGTVRLMPRPFFQNRFVQWLLAFVAGMFLAGAGWLVYFLLKKKSTTFEKFEQSEDEKKISDRVYVFIEESITKKDISLHWVAQELDLQAKQIERLIKKYKGKTFKDYLMFLRVEIAKEMLRSSHAGEKSIADSCGFKNVSEMEKYFSRFCRTTPYRFRKQNQVA
jgi:AraC-like DNA-binding protein